MVTLIVQHGMIFALNIRIFIHATKELLTPSSGSGAVNFIEWSGVASFHTVRILNVRGQ
jgi:hypothetical protein